MWTCRRTPASVASSGRIAWVAEEVHCAWRRERRRAGPRRGGRGSRAPARSRPRSARARARAARGRRRAGPPRRSSWVSRRTSSTNVSKRSASPGASSWSHSTGVSDSVSGAPLVEQVEQRQVAAGDRLPQPLLAERPGAEALDVGHVRVQDDRQGAASRGRSLTAGTPREVERAVQIAPRRRGAGAKSRHGDRGREPVVERPGEPQRRVHAGPSRARSASSCSAQLARVEEPVHLDAGEVRRGTARSNSSGRYSCTCHGLSERAAPLGASVSTLGVETNTVPAAPHERAEVLERRAGVLQVLDRLQEHDRVGGLGEGLDEVALEAQVRPGVAQPGVLVGLGVGVDADHLRGRAGEHVRAVALAAGHVDHARAPPAARRSTRRRRGGGGTSSSPRARRAACARRSAPAAGRPSGWSRCRYELLV